MKVSIPSGIEDYNLYQCGLDEQERFERDGTLVSTPRFKKLEYSCIVHLPNFIDISITEKDEGQFDFVMRLNPLEIQGKHVEVH